MNELVTRAAAIAELLHADHRKSQEEEFVDAVVGCCSDLIESGEPRAALELIDKVEIVGSPPGDLRIHLVVCRIRALRTLGDFRTALAIAERQLEESQASEMLFAELRVVAILAGGCLWQLNRVDEALGRLLKIRAELIGRPDSVQLASCMHELASAELFRGRLDQARTYAYETIVSARRTGSALLEAAGLMNLARIDKFLCRWASASDSLHQSLGLSEARWSTLLRNHR